MPSSVIVETASAPWWGVPIVAGVFLLLGAIVTFLFNFRIKQSELDHADWSRWDLELLNTSSAFLQSLLELVAHSSADSELFIMDLDERRRVQTTVRTRQFGLYQRLSLVGTQDICQAARDYMEAATDLTRAINYHQLSAEIQAHASETRLQFIAAVRRQIRVYG